MSNRNFFTFLRDPLRLLECCWPHVKLYEEQRQIVRSVMGDGITTFGNKRTLVPAGHMLGKDFITGFIVVAFFLLRHPARVVTTSVDGHQLESVLWGEMRRFIQSCRFPLEAERGGPLIINHLHIRKVEVSGPNKGRECPLSYIRGRVAKEAEGLSGHHIPQTGDGIPRTLAVGDEASGLANLAFEKMNEWANVELYIGNPYECENEFRWGVEGRVGTTDKGGDVPRDPSDPSKGYLRKVIHISGDDSPNVKLAREEAALGKKPSGKLVLPGVLPWWEYVERENAWPEPKKVPGLYGKFYAGAEVKMFPKKWLGRAAEVAAELAASGKQRRAKSIGIDPAEGGDKTAMVAVDELGVIEMVSRKTPNTDDVCTEAVEFMTRHGLAGDPQYVLFDRGGGGKEHADRMRARGWDVRTVAFGEAVTQELRRGIVPLYKRKEHQEEAHAYVNRRAQMYWCIREMIDPGANPGGFGLPGEYQEFFQQLAPIPLKYREGRLRLPPKDKTAENSTEKTLIELIGHSPDEADALALAVYGMLYESYVPEAAAS